MMRGHRGFTLLELLIGLVLLGFVMALLLAGFRLATSTWDAVEQRSERTTAALIGRNLVRRVLAQVQPVRWAKTVNRPITFIGERESLRAIAPLPGGAGVGGLRVIEISLSAAETGGKRRLLLRQAPVRYGSERFDEGIEATEPHVLLDGLDAADIAYFGPPGPNQDPVWQDSWPNTEQLPRLIRIHLAGDLDNSADLLIAPLIGGSGQCRWDAMARRCR
jgi:prepilin-type N-terminal cleavage/methylation domain-containing protein